MYVKSLIKCDVELNSAVEEHVSPSIAPPVKKKRTDHALPTDKGKGSLGFASGEEKTILVSLDSSDEGTSDDTLLFKWKSSSAQPQILGVAGHLFREVDLVDMVGSCFLVPFDPINVGLRVTKTGVVTSSLGPYQKTNPSIFTAATRIPISGAKPNRSTKSSIPSLGNKRLLDSGTKFG